MNNTNYQSMKNLNEDPNRNSTNKEINKHDEEKELLNVAYENRRHNGRNKQTLLEKIRYVKDNITLEFVVICTILSRKMSRLAVMNLNLDKACRVTLKYENSICDALIMKTANYHQEETEVQKIISSIEAWRSIITAAIPAVLLIFLGAWSDRTGNKKFCILLPIFGNLVTSISNLLNMYFFYEIPVQVTMFLEYVFIALTGDISLFGMGAFSYIGHITTNEVRTFRIGLLLLCFRGSLSIGTILSGFTLKATGYYGAFGISTVLHALALLCGYKYLENPKMFNEEIEKCTKTEDVLVKQNNLIRIFDIKNVKDTFSVIVKKRSDNRRLKLILILISVGLLHGPNMGEFTMTYLYTSYFFHWDAVQYSVYATFQMVCMFAGAMCSLIVCIKILKWDDAVLGAISTGGKLVGVVGIAFARNTSEMYAATALEALYAIALMCLRSISSKLVTREEGGKVMSIFNVVELTFSLIFVPMYSKLYSITLEVLPGSIFFLTSCLALPPLFIFSWFVLEHRRRVVSEKNAEKHAIEDNEADA